MAKDRVYLNSCELLIDSVVLYTQPQQQQLFFLWKKGKKFSKSNLYEIEANTSISIKQKLELGLKIYNRNGKNEIKNTHLFLMLTGGRGMREEGQTQLCQFTLVVNDWGLSYQKLQLQIKQMGRTVGQVILQVKRKEVMELQSFHRFSAQIEQSSQDEGNIIVMNTSVRGYQSETIRLQKQVEDYKYLNEKLKKDRAFLITRNQVLQKEINTIKGNINNEMKRMQAYYIQKLQIHTSIYQEELQSLITTFNETSETNSTIMRSIVNENGQLAAQLEELRITAEEQLQKQNSYYKNKLNEANDQRERLQDIISDLQAKAIEFQKQIAQANRKFQMIKQEFDLLTINSEIERKESKSKCEEYEKHMETQRKQISDLKNQLSDKSEQLKKSKEAEVELNEELNETNKALQKYKIKQIKMQNQLNERRQNISQLKRERDENLEFINKLERDYKKYIDQSEKTNSEYQKQLQLLESQTKDKQVQFQRLISQQRNKLYAEAAKLSQYISRYDDLEKDLIVKNEQIKTYIDENTKLNQQFLEEHTRVLQCEQENRELYHQIEQLKLTNQSNEDKMNLMTQELDHAYKKNHQDLELLRENYDETLKNREKYYEQQIQNLKLKLDHSESSYLKLTSDFTGEMDQYKQMMEKNQQQQLQSIKQMNQLLSNNRKLEEENKQFQILLNQLRLSMKQRQVRFEQTLRMYQTKQLEPANKFNQASSIDFEVDSNQKKNILDPTQKLSIQIPQVGRNYLSQEQKMEYYRQVESLGSLEHIKYLKQVEEEYKMNKKQMEKLQNQNMKLKLQQYQLKNLIEPSQKQINQLKLQIEKLTEIIQELKQQLRYYLEKEQEQESARQASVVNLDIGVDQLRENIKGNASFRSDHEIDEKKKFEDKSIQDSRQKKSLNRSKSRISRALSLINCKDAQVQVETINMKEIISYKQQLELLRSENRNNKVQNNKNQPVDGNSDGSEEKIKKKRTNKLSDSQRSLQFPPMQTKELLNVKKRNQVLTRKIEQIQQQNQQKIEQLRMKQIRVEKLESRNKQLFEELTSFKQQMGIKVSMQESKLLQFSELTKKQQEQYAKMRQTIMQKENQLKSTQQNFNIQIQALKGQIEKLGSENTKLKKDNQDKIGNKRGFGIDYSMAMQQDIEDANKKIIDVTRLSNQMRLQKQSLQDQLKVIRKKILDSDKNITILNDKRVLAQQQVQNITRKFNKTKRDLEERQSQLSRSKDQIKKMQDQLNNFGIVSSQALMERKKNLQQKLELEEQINKRDCEIRKLTKQLLKLKQHCDQINEFEILTKNQSLKKLEDIESEYMKIKRLNNELNDQVCSLTNKIDNIEEQHRSKLEQLKSQYKQKLNTLMNDIVDIKKILDANNQQKMNLQEENFNLREQLQNLSDELEKMDKEKAQFLLERTEYEKQIENNIRELEEIKKQLVHYQEDNIDLHNRFANLSDQLANERMLSTRKSEKVEQYESLSQKYEYELRNLKSLIKQQNDHEQLEQALNKQIQQLKIALQQVSGKLSNLKRQHESYTQIYKYSEKQIQELVLELQQNYEEVHRKNLADTKDQLDHEYEQKNIKREKEILELYNQNAKYRVQMKRKEDEYAELLQKYEEAQLIKQKYSKIKQDHEGATEQLDKLIERANKDQSKCNKYQLEIKQLQRIISDFNNQLNISKNETASQRSKSNRLQQELIELQTTYNITKDELKKVGIESRRQIQAQSSQLQGCEQKILSVELQNMRIKQRQENMHRQYKQQIRKLELKVKQSISQSQQQNVSLERQYKAKLMQKDRFLKEANRTLNSVEADFNTIKQQMTSLKKQNQQMGYELSTTRQQMSDDQQIYISEINKLKNNMKQMEEIYDYNINALEQQIADLNRQLTMQQLNNRQQSGLAGSLLRQSDVERRLDEKIKNKDNKIEQLKNNIFILQQTITNLKRKGQLDEPEERSSSQKHRCLYNELVVQLQNTRKKHELESNIQQQSQRNLKKQLAKAKQLQENLKLELDHQNLQLHSLRCELTTLKEVYDTLQKQVQRRQIKLTENVGVAASFQKKIQEKVNRIKQLQQQTIQKSSTITQLQLLLTTREKQNNELVSQLKRQAATVFKISNLNVDSRKVAQTQQQQIVCLRQQMANLVRENKRYVNEIDIFKNKIQVLERNQRQLDKLYKKLQLENNEIVQKLYQNEEIVGKFIAIDQKSKENYSVGVEELVLGGFIEEKVFDQEQELNLMKQEVEEMRFNEERRKMDFEQMCKQNLELKLNMQQLEVVQDQVETLRKICDKLEQEKKIAVFREQAVRIRLANLIQRNEPRENIRDGLEAILNFNYNVYA